MFTDPNIIEEGLRKDMSLHIDFNGFFRDNGIMNIPLRILIMEHMYPQAHHNRNERPAINIARLIPLVETFLGSTNDHLEQILATIEALVVTGSRTITHVANSIIAHANDPEDLLLVSEAQVFIEQAQAAYADLHRVREQWLLAPPISIYEQQVVTATIMRLERLVRNISRDVITENAQELSETIRLIIEIGIELGVLPGNSHSLAISPEYITENAGYFSIQENIEQLRRPALYTINAAISAYHQYDLNLMTFDAANPIIQNNIVAMNRMTALARATIEHITQLLSPHLNRIAQPFANIASIFNPLIEIGLTMLPVSFRPNFLVVNDDQLLAIQRRSTNTTAAALHAGSIFLEMMEATSSPALLFSNNNEGDVPNFFIPAAVRGPRIG